MLKLKKFLKLDANNGKYLINARIKWSDVKIE